MKVTAKVDDTKKHEYDVNHLLFHKGRLYSAGDDGKIKVWQPDLTFITEVRAHPCSVFALAASDDKLYSCSNDGSVKAWELDTLKQKGTIFNDGQTEIWKICYDDGHMYTGDQNGNIRVYNGEKCYGQINIAEPVKDMTVKNAFIYTVNQNDLVITQLKLGGEHLQFATIKTIDGKAPVTLINDKYLIFTSRSGKDILIHENSHESHYKPVTNIKNAHPMIINALLGLNWDNNTVLISGGWDKIIRKWKISGDQVQQEEPCNVNIIINALCSGDKGTIYAAGGDGHIVRINM